MSKYTIGIDLGGTTMTAGLVDENYDIVGKITWATRLPRPAADLEKALADLCRAVARENKVAFSDIAYVGIGTPGSVNFNTGFVGFNTNFGYHDLNLGPDMEKLLGCKVYVENDANAAAFGEYIAGGAKGYRNAVIITLGTGIGSGIILNGKMFNGGMNQGTELGHAYLVDGGEHCTCGNNGCMEAYCAASALAREGARAMQRDPRGLLSERSGGNAALIDAKMVVDCAKAGDVTAKRVFDEYIGHLSSTCASFFNILDPEVIAIGGGLCGAGEFLFAPLRERITEKCFYKSHGAVVPAVMGNDAGIIGAAMLRRDTELR